MTRRHNNANVMVFAGTGDVALAKQMAEKFLSTEFEGGRHGCRVDQMNAGISVTDPAIDAIIREEEERQQNNIELIASENFVSETGRFTASTARRAAAPVRFSTTTCGA